MGEKEDSHLTHTKMAYTWMNINQWLSKAERIESMELYNLGKNHFEEQSQLLTARRSSDWFMSLSKFVEPNKVIKRVNEIYIQWPSGENNLKYSFRSKWYNLDASDTIKRVDKVIEKIVKGLIQIEDYNELSCCDWGIKSLFFIDHPTWCKMVQFWLNNLKKMMNIIEKIRKPHR